MSKRYAAHPSELPAHLMRAIERAEMDAKHEPLNAPLENDGGDWKPGDPWPLQQTPEPPGRFRQDMHTRQRCWRWESRSLVALGALWAGALALGLFLGWLTAPAPVARSTPVQMEYWQ